MQNVYVSGVTAILRDVLAERVGLREHVFYVSDHRHVLHREALVKGGGSIEHVAHVGDRRHAERSWLKEAAP